jgi:hypothetical protein
VSSGATTPPYGPVATLYGPLTALAVLAALSFLWKRSSSWARLALHYPLKEEWPDRTYPDTMVAVDGLMYRVSIGANSRGLTFHGFVQRLMDTASFVPWSEVVAREGRSWYFRELVRVHFKKAPGVEVGVPSAVWLNIIASALPHSASAAAFTTATGV